MGNFFLFFHFRENSRGYLLSMVVKYKLNDAAYSEVVISKLTDGYWRQ